MILDDLENLFKDNEFVKITRGDNFITFEQEFTNDIHATAQLFERQKMTFSHTVTLYDDNSYKTTDRLHERVVTPTGIQDKESTGVINSRGWFYGLGINYRTGEEGLIKHEWSTEDIKAPVREYLNASGLRERPPFWTGKRIALAFGIGWGLALILALVLFLTVGHIEFHGTL